MRRYPFTVPGLVRLTSGGGLNIVDRLRGAMEPLIMAMLHRFDGAVPVRAISSDEVNTLTDAEYPREWWVRTAFIPAKEPDPSAAAERAWLTIEYSRWEDSEDWCMQAFFRVAEVEFSLGTSSDGEPGILQLVAAGLPARDIGAIEEVLRAHFGGPGASAGGAGGSNQHTVSL
jgi:hypothetical protein